MLIQAKNITKVYINSEVKTKALRGVSFNINKGEFISIVGPSGCGKSTLLYILSGLEPFDDGDLEVLNINLKVATKKEKTIYRASKIGFVFQSFELIANLNVLENIMLASIISKNKRSRSKIMELLKLVEMDGYESYYPDQLSGGQKQRVAIARALINNPDIILADEPTGNLDEENGLKIIEIFKKINEQFKTTILMVTHNLDLIKSTTRTLYMLDGKIVKDEDNS